MDQMCMHAFLVTWKANECHYKLYSSRKEVASYIAQLCVSKTYACHTFWLHSVLLADSGGKYTPLPTDDEDQKEQPQGYPPGYTMPNVADYQPQPPVYMGAQQQSSTVVFTTQTILC